MLTNDMETIMTKIRPAIAPHTIAGDMAAAAGLGAGDSAAAGLGAGDLAAGRLRAGDLAARAGGIGGRMGSNSEVRAQSAPKLKDTRRSNLQ